MCVVAYASIERRARFETNNLVAAYFDEVFFYFLCSKGIIYGEIFYFSLLCVGHCCGCAIADLLKRCCGTICICVVVVAKVGCCGGVDL